MKKCQLPKRDFMVFRVVLVLLFTQWINAQVPFPKMLDSLAKISTEEEKAKLSMEIASRLASDDWKRALYYMNIAEKSAKKSKSEKIIADYHIAEAEIYSEKGAWDITLENLVHAYGFYKDRPLKERYRLENDLAIAYAETEYHDKALEFFHKIYGYEHTQQSPLNLALISNNMGLVWMKKDLDSSRHYFNKSLRLIKDIENPGFKTLLYTNMGKASNLQDDDQAARQYFHLAINQIDLHNSKEDLAWVYGEFSELFLKNEKLDSAIFYSRNAMKILDSLEPFGLEQLQAVEVLYKSYVKNREFEKATNTFEKFLAISDSLNLEEKRLNVQKLILEEEYRTKDQIRELEERESRSKTYSLMLGLFALFLILLIFLFRYRARLKRAELEKQLVTMSQKKLSAKLELKNKELIGKAMIEMHRTEIIDEVLKKLKHIRLKADKKEMQLAIDQVAKQLKQDTPSDAWNEFELRFEQVHESFYKNLMATHPDLTSRDRRLCALLSLNLTSKEIAQVTGQSSKTVENARTRLRNKLGITNSQTDLSGYLSSFG